jgi:hypothetical protein
MVKNFLTVKQRLASYELIIHNKELFKRSQIKWLLNLKDNESRDQIRNLY